MRHSVRKAAGKAMSSGDIEVLQQRGKGKEIKIIVGFAGDTSGEFQKVQWNIRERSEEWKGWTWSWRNIWYLD